MAFAEPENGIDDDASVIADIPVSVVSSDSVLRAGLRALLAASHRVRMVDADSPFAAVGVVVEDAVSAELFTSMRRRAAVGSTARLPLVVVTKAFPAPVLLPAIEAGVVGVVPRREATARLERAIVEAANGHAQLPPRLQRDLIRQLERVRVDVLEPNNLTATGFTPREQDVVRLLADGLETAEVAQRLRYSERTVKNILHGLLTRLHLRNRAHAVAYALRVGAI